MAYKRFRYSKALIDDKLKKQIADVKQHEGFKSFRAASKALADEYELLRWQRKKHRL